MIKIYVDWNVMSGMKRDNFRELQTILDNKEKFLLLYSTAHIGDIYASYSQDTEQLKTVQEDLEFLTLLTDNLCLSNNGKNVVLGYQDPKRLLEGRVNDSDLFYDFSIDKLFSIFEEEESLKPLISPLKNLMSSLSLETSFIKAYDTPEGAEIMDKFFPGLKDNLTLDGLFKSFSKMYKNMNEGEDYKGLRETIQKIGINSGHFNKDKNPFDVIDKAYKKIGMENFSTDDYMGKTKNAPEWFNDVVNEYLILDMHGFKADKVKVTEKEKKTFKNTSEDAFHSAFASRCEFYITNDNKNYEKTKAVFNKLGILTKILKPNEFIDYYKKYLNIGFFDNHFNKVVDLITKEGDFYKSENEDENGYTLIHYSKYFLFNFFNKIMITKSNTNNYAGVVLGKEHSAKNYFIVHKEIEGMIKLFVDKFGIDSNGKSYYEPGEVDSENWEGRFWQLKTASLRILRINGWFQLYFYPNQIETDRV